MKAGMWTGAITGVMAFLAGAANADVIVLTRDTVIGVGNRTYDGHDLVVRGCRVAINGRHRFASLTVERSTGGVVNPGMVYHEPMVTDGDVKGMLLEIDSNLTVQGFQNGQPSRIMANGCGYVANQGPGTTTTGKGAGHAGYGNGGNFFRGEFGGAPYGSIDAPVEFGSGGGVDPREVNPLSMGGGAIHLRVQGIALIDGIVEASGEGTNTNGGAGSGGSIWIEAGRYSGIGSIIARGGRATGGGGGSGGRIAIHARIADATIPFPSTQGESGSNQGPNGTIYYRVGDALPDLTFVGPSGTGDGAAPYTPIPPLTVGRVIFRYGGHARFLPGFRAMQAVTTAEDFSRVEVVGNARFGSLTLVGGGLIIPMHDTFESPVQITVDGDATIGGRGIDATARGYPGGQGPGAGLAGATRGSGGGHASPGGASTSAATLLGGDAYGSMMAPTTPGSGGGHTRSNIARAGGGAFKLNVGGVLNAQAPILSDGGQSNWGLGLSERTGGGAGGSIWIQCGTLQGDGLIAARGGGTSTPDGPGGGSGGRIRIDASASTFRGDLAAHAVSASSASASNAGAGTIVVAIGGRLANVTIDNRGTLAPRPTPMLEEVDCDGLFRVIGGATLTSAAGLPIVVHARGGIEIGATSSITVTGQGFGPGLGLGAGAAGNTGAGGGYGGAGGNGTPNALGGAPYGSAFLPTLLGSGGGAGATRVAGSGGGAILLSSEGDLNIAGTLTADGAPGVQRSVADSGGGGSGGSILLRGNRLVGEGSFQARGGAANLAGGGGGGRIAALFTECLTASQRLRFQVGGGAGVQPGARGTVYFRVFPDLNLDGVVNSLDYDLFVSHFTTAEAWADFNQDGFIDQFDYIEFLDAFARPCGNPSGRPVNIR